MAAVVQHWLMVGTIWGDPTRSLDKVWEAVRAFVNRMAVAMDDGPALGRVLADKHVVWAWCFSRGLGVREDQAVSRELHARRHAVQLRY